MIRSGRCTPELEQFEILGHRVDKVELIVMGGTMTARPVEYQESFVSRCIEAMNTYPGGPLLHSPLTLHRCEAENEHSAIRCVAITFETRPDWCRREHIDRMLGLGRDQGGARCPASDDAMLAFNRRGCTVADTVEANTLLRDAGLKVGFHMMPNLPVIDNRSRPEDVRYDLHRPPFQAGLPQDLPDPCHPGLGDRGPLEAGTLLLPIARTISWT